jgi:SAM-dependent methyltransferase
MKPIAYDLMAEFDESYWWYRARREILCDVIARAVPPQSDIVDFGAGAGATAALLGERGYRVVAAEVSEAALEACRMRELRAVDLRKEQLQACSADCVLAGDVLEHVDDDLTLLMSLRRVLRPGGVLVATVPAYEFLWSGEDYVSEHVRRYTRAGLKRQLHKAGFDCVRCTYFNTLLLPTILAVTVTKRLLFPREMYKSDVKPLRDWQNGTLYRLFAFERRLLRWLSLPAGASLLAVARPAERSA